jgi:hypothetical protein
MGSEQDDSFKFFAFGNVARGFIAIGNVATGVIAIGNVAYGVVAVGLSISVGVFAGGLNAIGILCGAGLNAAGLVSFAAINGLGAACWAGVNGLGVWGAGGVNMGTSAAFGFMLAVVYAVAVGLAPKPCPLPALAPLSMPAIGNLRDLLDGTVSQAWITPARVQGSCDALEILQDGVRATVSMAPSVADKVNEYRALASTIVLLGVAAKEERDPGNVAAGYRQAPPSHRVLECFEVIALPRPPLFHRLAAVANVSVRVSAIAAALLAFASGIARLAGVEPWRLLP